MMEQLDMRDIGPSPGVVYSRKIQVTTSLVDKRPFTVLVTSCMVYILFNYTVGINLQLMTSWLQCEDAQTCGRP